MKFTRRAIFQLMNLSNEKVMEVAEDATAYPWRETTGLVMMSFGSDARGQEVAAELRAECVATSGYDGLSVYSSVGHGDETPEQMFGNNAPRLVELKKKWDPANAFAYMHALPTEPSKCK
ncbi:hypothetical protein B0I35DRAFT_484397 [Stachybotrys elegans]|uniref:Berberine/berberine-like domain-containing protein n=1 Tax=Stachybotrys elegans TaxID=80388 RepID=A0A8K0WLH5_9HYPO|nr:hypothetical protein B0I35DRAFT_484397 [Stachybotrys elegans]